MSRISETARGMRPGVFAELERHLAARLAKGGDVIPLHIGDTYLAPPSPAHLGAFVEKDGPDATLYRYGPTGGLPALKEAIRAWLDRRSAVESGADVDLLVGVGATHALYCTARVIFDPGDDVLVCAPYWPLAPGIFHQAGARSIEVPFTSRLYADPSLDAGALLRGAITETTRAIYFITPNNPDGKVLSRAQLESVLAFAEEADLWVFADEVYADVTFDAPHVPFASLPGAAARTVTLHSFSKMRALAGARVGFAVAPGEVVTLAQRMGVHTVYNVPLAMQRAALAALADEAWTARARETYRAARDAAARALEGSRFHLAEGGTYLFLDFSEALRGRPITELLALGIDNGVMIAPGAAFGETYATSARICFTSVPEALVTEGIRRLREALARF
jgi:aspartate/methionine/tyrosine aminotransferase